MKYYTTIFSLFFLSLIGVLLSLYFGGLSNQIEKNIISLKSQINVLHEQIKINELEFAFHINKKYLLELQKIYLINNHKDLSLIKFINLSDLRKKDMQQILKISTK